MLRTLAGLVLLLVGLALGGCSIYWTKIVFILGFAEVSALLTWAFSLGISALCIWGGLRLMKGE